MLTYGKPKIGLLALMLDTYEPIFRGITARQERYMMVLAASIRQVADVYCPGVRSTREQIEQAVDEMNQMDLDGILIVMLTYNSSIRLIRALQKNRLPLAMAVVQPDQTVLDDWKELDLTVNQGIHGSQDNANAITRSGLNCQYFAGNRNDDRFVNFVADFSKAAQTYRLLKRMRVAVFGRMPGMGDILTDEMAFYRIIGPEFIPITLGRIYGLMEQVDTDEINNQIARDRQTFTIDPHVSCESHSYAIRMYLAFKKFLEQNNYQAFTAQFDIFADDGRFAQVPLLAASHLMADGYGYAAEGDMTCAALVATANCLGRNDGNFSEMYAMDFTRNAILFCHTGEGNWASGSPDKKPRLIDHYFGEGGLGNMPTPVFTSRPGPATVVSLASLEGGKFRLVLATGEILSEANMKNNEMPYFFFRPDSGVETCVEAWLRFGGTHHEAIGSGNQRIRWQMLCQMLGIEFCAV